MVFCSRLQRDPSPSATVLLAWPPAPGMELPQGRCAAAGMLSLGEQSQMVWAFLLQKGVSEEQLLVICWEITAAGDGPRPSIPSPQEVNE